MSAWYERSKRVVSIGPGVRLKVYASAVTQHNKPDVSSVSERMRAGKFEMDVNDEIESSMINVFVAAIERSGDSKSFAKIKLSFRFNYRTERLLLYARASQLWEWPRRSSLQVLLVEGMQVCSEVRTWESEHRTLRSSACIDGSGFGDEVSFASVCRQNTHRTPSLNNLLTLTCGGCSTQQSMSRFLVMRSV